MIDGIISMHVPLRASMLLRLTAFDSAKITYVVAALSVCIAQRTRKLLYSGVFSIIYDLVKLYVALTDCKPNNRAHLHRHGYPTDVDVCEVSITPISDAQDGIK